MRILFLGDVMGRAGRSAVIEALPNLRQDMKLDAIVVNAENATSGAGLNAAHAKGILEAGADCITLGDHAFDQKDMLTFIQSEPRIVRPLNYSKAAPGRGVYVVSDRRGRKLLVAQVLGQVFMKRPFDDPFSAVDEVLNRHPLGGALRRPLLISIVRQHQKKWRWVIIVMAALVQSLGPTRTSRPRIQCFCPVARHFKVMQACVVIITA